MADRRDAVAPMTSRHTFKTKHKKQNVADEEVTWQKITTEQVIRHIALSKSNEIVIKSNAIVATFPKM